MMSYLPDSRALTLGSSAVTMSAAGPPAWKAEGVVGITMHNQANTLRSCLQSIAQQQGISCPLAILILDDASRDDWTKTAGEYLLRPDVVVAHARCGSAARARNTLLDLIDHEFPRARWVARLDADDRFATPHSLAAAEKLTRRPDFGFVLGGNRLRRDGILLQGSNFAAPELLDRANIISRLDGMARGLPEAELPSCNLLLARGGGWRYPEQTSAEDHWLVARLLLQHAAQGAILTEPLYCDYSLNGAVTRANHNQNRYLAARQALLAAARTWAPSKGTSS